MPSEWIQKNIDLSYDNTSYRNGMVDLGETPYLIDPLDFFGRDAGGKMTVMAIEQTGKSSIWKWGCIWTMVFRPGPMLIVYPSDEDASDTNTDSFEPLMRSVSRLRIELDNPKTRRKDRFRFSNMSCYFAGSGKDIISKPVATIVGDEVDFWVTQSGRASNIDNMDKRGRTFPNAKRVIVCSPTKRSRPVAVEYGKSSKGSWHLRCVACGQFLASHEIRNMQWETDDNKRVVNDSIRLICPACKMAHVESQKGEMNRSGKYIHAEPSLIESHVGYQWGALAVSWMTPELCWKGIASAQMDSGRGSGAKARRKFWNSFRGLPEPEDRVDSEQASKLLEHCAINPPAPDTIENLFLTADTQDAGWFWEVRGYDVNGSFPLVAYGFTEYLDLSDEKRAEINAAKKALAIENGETFSPVLTLDDVFNAEYLGWIRPIVGLIDQGGHRKKEVVAYVADRSGFFSYMGNNRQVERWKLSESQAKLILAKERDYQSDLLYYLYVQKNKESEYWWLLSERETTEEYLAHISGIRQNDKVRDGHLFENWTDEGRKHDWFDCGKMFLVLLEFSLHVLDPRLWRRKQCEEIRKLIPEPSAGTSSAPPASGGWMSGMK